MERVIEGKATVYFPEGKISKRDEVFFNPSMRVNRDISILAARTFSEMNHLKLNVIDAFSATGVRGIRYALECKQTEHVIFNDLNPRAVEFIKKNIVVNKLEVGYEVLRKDSRILFLEKRGWASLIDIDPFGTPAPYIDAATNACANLCLVGITATDTAPLCGTYPKVALRRYFTKTLRFDAMQEQGMRVLISFLVREFAKHDKAFYPLICLAERHYFRIIGMVKKGSGEANKVVGKAKGYLNVCMNCGYRELSEREAKGCPFCKNNKIVSIHPIWIGGLFSKPLCEQMLRICEKEKDIYSKKSKEILSFMVDESDVNYIMYDLHFLAKLHKIKHMASIDEILSTLSDAGFNACRTHIKSTGIRTDAPLHDILEALKKRK